MRATTVARAFRWHAWAYTAGAAILVLANVSTGGGWWSFWPLAVWSVAFAVHYMVHKTSTVDDAWVEERTDDLHSKSYDASHIDRIAEDPPGKSTVPRPK
ncbi:MAG: 2TM domain-containing protein [Burkholderiales bacterium]